jgi:hypothetical protein
MSVGTWVLAAFGPAAGIAAISEAAPLLPLLGEHFREQRRVGSRVRHSVGSHVRSRLGSQRFDGARFLSTRSSGSGTLALAARLLPPVGRAAGLAAAGLAPALATYTAVLLADTANPSWHEAYPELPLVFAGSALASGAGVGLIGAPPDQSGPARRLAVIGAALELVGAHSVETRLGLLSEPYRLGRPGRLLRLGRALTAAGVAGAWLGRRSRVVSAISGASLLVASLATRFGIFEGGVASAKDPRYTVVPQRARIEQREREAGANVPGGKVAGAKVTGSQLTQGWPTDPHLTDTGSATSAERPQQLE